MKTISVCLFAILLASCSKNMDLEIRDGIYTVRAPISIDSVLVKDKWILQHDDFFIVRDGDTIFSTHGFTHGDRYELFPSGANPYYDESFSGGTLVSVSWGFYFYPQSGKTFCLER